MAQQPAPPQQVGPPASRAWPARLAQLTLVVSVCVWIAARVLGSSGPRVAGAAGVILSEAPHAQDEVNLIVDVGTNAEIVLGNRDRLLAASSPTGPAFEGAQISSGQRAAPGAIERVRIDRDTLAGTHQAALTDADRS